MDRLTVLVSRPGLRLAKLWRPDATKPDDYDAGYEFQVLSFPVAGLADLWEALKVLDPRSDTCVVRGEPVRDFGVEFTPRRSVARPNVPAPFVAAARYWLAVDVDETTVPFDPSAPENAVAAWAETLPPGLRGAGFVWQFSAKAHVSPTLRGRAWFWNTTALSDRPLRRWANGAGFDPALYTPVGVHYTAAPVFVGMAEPLAGRRLLLVDGPPATLTLADVGDEDDVDAVRADGVDVGPPSPAYDAARASVLERLGLAWAHVGQRFHLAGALGGMCRKAGWPAGDCAELVREWASVGSTDPEGHVRRALGAYTLPPEAVTGAGELMSLVGDEMGEAVADAVDAPSEAVGTFLAQTAARVPPAAPGEPFPALCRMVDIKVPVPQREYMIPGLRLDRGKISIIGGYAGAAKGPLLNLIAVCRAAGVDLFGTMPLRPGHVLFLDAETGEEAVRRIQRMAAAVGAPLEALEEHLHFGTLCPSAEPSVWRPDLERACRQWPDLLICVDSYTSAMFASGFESVKTEYAVWANDLGLLSRDYGCTVLAAMHARKDTGRGLDLEAISGTNALAAMTQTAVLLQRPDPKDEFVFDVSCARAPAGRFDAFTIKWEGADPEPLNARILPAEEAAKIHESKRDAKERLEDAHERASLIEGIMRTVRSSGSAMTPKEIALALGVRPEKLTDLLRELAKAGGLHQGGAYYSPGLNANSPALGMMWAAGG